MIEIFILAITVPFLTQHRNVVPSNEVTTNFYGSVTGIVNEAYIQSHGGGGGGDITPAIDYTTAVSNKMEAAVADRYTKSEADGRFVPMNFPEPYLGGFEWVPDGLALNSESVFTIPSAGNLMVGGYTLGEFLSGGFWNISDNKFIRNDSFSVVSNKVEQKADKATTLSGYGITDAYETNSAAFSKDVKVAVSTQLDAKRDKGDLCVYELSESWEFVGGDSGQYRLEINDNADPSHPERFVYLLGDDSIQEVIDEHYSDSSDLSCVFFQKSGITALRSLAVVRDDAIAKSKWVSENLTNIAVVTDSEIDYGKSGKFTRILGSSIDLSGFTYANRIIYMNADFASLTPERIYFRNRNNKTLIDIIRDEMTNDVVAARTLSVGSYCFTNNTVSVSLPSMPTVGNPVTVGSETVSTDDGSTYVHSPSGTKVFLGNCTRPQIFMATEVNDEAQNLRYTITADDGRFFFTPTRAINQED